MFALPEAHCAVLGASGEEPHDIATYSTLAVPVWCKQEQSCMDAQA